MTTSPLFDISGAGLIEDAYNIAWNYLLRSGQVFDEYESHVILSRELSWLVANGEGNALRLANRAISAYERDIQMYCEAAVG